MTKQPVFYVTKLFLHVTVFFNVTVFVWWSLPEKGAGLPKQWFRLSSLLRKTWERESPTCSVSGCKFANMAEVIFLHRHIYFFIQLYIYDSHSYTYFLVEEIKHIELHFIFSCTCGGSHPKPSKTQACLPTLLPKATHVVFFDNIPHQKHCTVNRETDTSASNQVQMICKVCW